MIDCNDWNRKKMLNNWFNMQDAMDKTNTIVANDNMWLDMFSG